MAFVLSPGLAALAGAVAVATRQGIGGLGGQFGEAVVGAFYWAYGFALVGYTTAVIFAVPLYILLPERARSAVRVVVPLAGATAAVPWIPIIAIWRVGFLPIGIAFGLGCVAGVAFVLIRRAPDSSDRGETP